jgi:D-alanyl-D-alanine carboxypeptidase
MSSILLLPPASVYIAGLAAWDRVIPEARKDPDSGLMLLRDKTIAWTLTCTLALCVTASFSISRAAAEAQILVDVETGKVLHAENATAPWYPASITKIMTTYATLRAVKEGRITLDKLLTVSPNALAQSPVKMGFPVGTTITVDNALKMLLVKSANDMAVVLAEGVGGSIENFADLMNWHAQRLGMTQSHFVNPNGLPADEQVTSARDMAILARAAIREFPEYDYYWHLPGIRFGKKVLRNYNTLIGRYPGADGMKTGFICASGFNLVATATRDGKRLIAVVLGAPSSAGRAIKAAQLLERGFASDGLGWLMPQLGNVEALVPVNAEPPNLREDMCGKHRKKQASEDEDDSAAIASLLSSSGSAYSVFLSALRAPDNKQALLQQEARLGEPVVVFTGPANKQADAPASSKTKGAIPKTNPAPLAGPELASRSDNGAPTPRPKPKVVRPTAAPANTTHATATQSTAPQTAARPPAPKTNAKTTDAKTTNAKTTNAKTTSAKTTSAKTTDPKADPQKK